MRLKSVSGAGLTLSLVMIAVLSRFTMAVSSPEQRGPKIDKLRFKVIKGPDAQVLGMQTGEVDVLTDLIRTRDIERLDGEGFTITSAPYFHMGHMVFNIRADQSYRDYLPSPFPPAHGKTVAPILSDINFRHACFHAYNQEEICASIYRYIVTPIHSLVPPAQGTWLNPNVPRHPYDPGDKYTETNEKNADGNYTNRYPFDYSSCGILRYSGYVYSPELDNWVTPFDLDDDGTTGTTGVCKQHFDNYIQDSDDVMPKVYVFAPSYEASPRSARHAARWIEDLNDIGLTSIELLQPEGPWQDRVFGWADFDIAMIFWVLGRFPDHLYDMCHSSQDTANHPWRSNLPGINDPTLDDLVETLGYSLNHTEKMTAAHEAQKRLYDETNPQALAYMQLYSRTYFSAFKPGLKGIVGSPGYGSHNSWMHLNMRWQPGHPNERIEDGKTTVIWCLGDEPERLNPLYAGRWAIWATWDVFRPDVQVLDRICDPLIMLNPYTHEDLPWLATDWDAVGPVDIPEKDIVGGMTVTFWLNNTIHWHDGNPYVAEDAKFNWLFLRDNEIPMWSWMWEHMVDVEVIDTNTVKVYSDVTSQFLVYYLSASAALLPPPVWEPIDGQPLDEILEYDPSTNTTKPLGAGPKFGTSECPTQLYGTGPFVSESYNSTGMVVELHANRDYFKTNTEIHDLLVEMFHRAGDVDRDGEIGILDLSRQGRAYFTWPPNPLYDVDADVNSDGIVDIRDIALTGRYYGKKREYP